MNAPHAPDADRYVMRWTDDGRAILTYPEHLRFVADTLEVHGTVPFTPRYIASNLRKAAALLDDGYRATGVTHRRFL